MLLIYRLDVSMRGLFWLLSQVTLARDWSLRWFSDLASLWPEFPGWVIFSRLLRMVVVEGRCTENFLMWSFIVRRYLAIKILTCPTGVRSWFNIW